jgi:hypothetical protein
VDTCNILRRWLWSPIHKVTDRTMDLFILLSVHRFWDLIDWSWFVMCRFLGQFLLLFFLHQTSLALFRVMASLGRNMIVANTFGSFALLVVMILGGFIITKGWLLSNIINHFRVYFQIIYLIFCNPFLTI